MTATAKILKKKFTTGDVVTDLFCGGGGTTTGAKRALERLGYKFSMVAINHWDLAIESHTANHPDVTHYCQSIDTILPQEVIPGRKLKLLLASPECFPAGTLVLTEKGYTPIEKIKTGDLVLTHRNRWRTVTSKMASLKDTIIVKGQGHPGLETTAEHPFYTRKRRQRHRPENGNYHRYENPEWCNAEDLSERNLFWGTPSRIEKLPVQQVGGRGFDFTNDFWWLVGLWLAEGTVRIRPTNSEITLACGNHEADRVEKQLAVFASSAKRAGCSELRWRRRTVKTATLFETGHAGLAEWLIEHFGKLATGKRIPAWVYGLPQASRQALLSGYLQGDGSVKRKASNSPKQTCQTVSYPLAYGIKTLAATLGCRASVHSAPPRNNPIQGRTVKIAPALTVEWTLHPQRNESFDDGEHHWTHIKSVAEGRSQIEVFNLSVEEDESYVVEGIVVHNCTDHSNAKGGKPRSDQKRADAWLLQRWIEKLDIDTIIIENVKEFQNWGPLTKKGLPDKRKRGTFFRNFINFLEISYTVEWRILNAADYGDATTRERFILIAKKGKSRKIEFPAPTHASRKNIEKLIAQPDLFGTQLKRWRSAAEIIDWSKKGKSVFGRKHPLSPNTMKRIFAGLRKYSGIDLPDREVYVVKSLFSFVPKAKREKISMVYRDDYAENFEKNKYLIAPLWEFVIKNEKGKIIAHYQHPSVEELESLRARKQAEIDHVVRQTPIKIDWSKCQPFTLQNEGFFRGNASGRDIKEPIPTVTQRGAGKVIAPFAVNLKASDRRMRPITDPTFTQTTANHQYLCETFVTNLSHTQNNDESMCKSSGEPLPTICGKGMLGLFESLPFMVQSYGERIGQEARTREITAPTWTITPQVRMNLVEPSLVKYYLGSDAVSVREPVPTITANYEHIALTTPFIVPCNHGAGDTRTHSVEDPMKTITHVDGFAFVEPFLVIFKNNQDSQSIGEPLKTLTTRDSYGLVEIQIATAGETAPIPVDEVGLYIPYLGIILFIRFRMFHETELARAMGFPEDYQFAGTRQDRVTQIGNAVPCGLSEAVVYTAMAEESNKIKKRRNLKKAH